MNLKRVVRNSNSFIMLKIRGNDMSIGRVLKENQPDSYKKLNKIRNDNKKELSERDIKELMHHSSYRRSSRGAIKQVR
ncbi:hypothetical protein [Clostridium celatum]|uniref:hypothetical protein n=1 Tax=Clostridium celatum TaxID=36834 RepID=UPI0028FE1530|nr:hypothetical protein [Clostridium celatum]MDU2266680.1 hypothetical protein [Clostridium celatum]MDU6297075.1 hypothetical protein [Clostridium celatum]